MQKEFVDNRFGTNQPVKVKFHRYATGNNVAIQLVCDDGECLGEPWCTASVNVPGVPLADNLVAIKTYSENEGIDDLLIKAGVLQAGAVRHLISGHAMIPIYRLTSDALAEAAAVPKR